MDWNSRRITSIIERALLEDRATRDATSAVCIDPKQLATGTVIAKQDCTLAGVDAVTRVLEVFATLDGADVSGHPEVTSHPEIFDGVRLRKGQTIAVIRHQARVILSCERVILNLMQRMSGIATLTRQYVDAISGTKARILDTRKTAPGLRLLDKFAVRCGGGTNHRLDLSDGILIKNNHIALVGSAGEAMRRAIANRNGSQPIQIEVRSLEELDDALRNGADSILLDNMSHAEVGHCVEFARVFASHAGRTVPLECSGGMNLETVGAYAQTGVDFISVGALTHSVKAVDMSLRVTPGLGLSRQREAL